MSRLLRRDLQAVLNTYSAENTSNTPDWILADYLLRCLDAFDLAVLAREQFYGIKSEPGTDRYPSVTDDDKIAP